MSVLGVFPDATVKAVHFFCKMKPAKDIVASRVELYELAVYKGVETGYVRTHAVGE